MSLESHKLNLIEQLMHVNDESVLNRLLDILKKERSKSKAERLKPMTIEELERKLEQSEQDIKDGRVYTSDEVRNILKVKNA